MSRIDEAAKIASAQAEIQKILGALEADIGRSVYSASLERIDTTSIQDAAPTFVREFVIQMSAPPNEF